MASYRKSVLGMWMLVQGALVLARTASASTSVEFLPSPPEYAQPLSVRLTDSVGPRCWPKASSILRAGTVVTLNLDSEDSCAPADQLPYRDYALGSFLAGSYLFVYRSCYYNPPPLPSDCSVAAQAPFVVVPPPVPALSRWALFALSIGIPLTFWLCRSRRRRR